MNRKHNRQNKIQTGTVIFILSLVLYTTYVLLDTFIIPRAYDMPADEGRVRGSASKAETNGDIPETILPPTDTPVPTVPAKTPAEFPVSDAEPAAVAPETPSPAPTRTPTLSPTPSPSPSPTLSPTPSPTQTPAPLVDDTHYYDDNIFITLNKFNRYQTDIYFGDIVLTSPEYLKTAFANNRYGKNIKKETSSIAEDVNAIFAINGDFYGARNDGYVIRGGILYRNKKAAERTDLVIFEDGSFGIINENGITAEELVANGAWDVLSFGPVLVENGEVLVDEDEEVGQASLSNPRTAIGYIDELHYCFIVSDGRVRGNKGLTLFELATIAAEMGVKVLYNLDGGGSSTMVLNGKVVNVPVAVGTTVTERNVSDIVYIGY